MIGGTGAQLTTDDRVRVLELRLETLEHIVQLQGKTLRGISSALPRLGNVVERLSNVLLDLTRRVVGEL